MATQSAQFHPDQVPCPEQELAVLRRRVRILESQLAARRAEELAASEAERRLEDFAASTSGWFWETDAEGRFKYFSRSVENVTGVCPEWHYGKSREDIGIPDAVSIDAWNAHLDALRNRQPFIGFVFRRRGPDGLKWLQTSGLPVFDAHGEFVGYRGTGLDVSQRVEAQRRADLLALAIENLTEKFVLWDAADTLVVCNARFRQINERVAHTTQPGTRFEDHIRAALAAGLYPGAEGREEEWLAERLERHRNPEGPFELERQGGRWIQITEHRLPDGCTVTVSVDITARKLGELELERHKTNLERLVTDRTAHLQDANEEIKRFTYVVSHDLRAPLVSVTGFANELDKDCQRARELLEANAKRLEPAQRDELMQLLGENVPEALGFIEAAAARMDRQIAALLKYSRLGGRKLVPEPLDVAAIVGECLDSMGHQIERSGIQVRIGRFPDLVSDAFALEQILGNLIDNAIKFLDPNRNGRIVVTGQADGPSVRLEVADNGRGLAGRDLERIFQVFVRAAPAEITGIGMGLAEVQALVRRLGGRVWCESELDRGSSFFVELPATPPEDQATPAGSRGG